MSQHTDGSHAAEEGPGAAGSGDAAAPSRFAKHNTAEKKDSLRAKRARAHEADIDVLVRRCHRHYENGAFSEVGEKPGSRLGFHVEEGTSGMMYDPSVAQWVHVLFLRVIKTRKGKSPDMVAAVRVNGGSTIVAPFPCARRV